MERWYVAQTRSNEEGKAALHLARQGFAPYLPRYLKKRRHARKVDLVERPLFPRYLFVRMDPDASRWRAILSTIGITHLVCQGGLPAAVPTGVVEEIMAREDAEGYVAMVDAPVLPRPGEAVQVGSGPFADCQGIFCAVTDDERVSILLDLMGRPVKVTIPRDALAPRA